MKRCRVGQQGGVSTCACGEVEAAPRRRARFCGAGRARSPARAMPRSAPQSVSPRACRSPGSPTTPGRPRAIERMPSSATALLIGLAGGHPHRPSTQCASAFIAPRPRAERDRRRNSPPGVVDDGWLWEHALVARPLGAVGRNPQIRVILRSTVRVVGIATIGSSLVSAIALASPWPIRRQRYERVGVGARAASRAASATSSGTCWRISSIPSANRSPRWRCTSVAIASSSEAAINTARVQPRRMTSAAISATRLTEHHSPSERLLLELHPRLLSRDCGGIVHAFVWPPGWRECGLSRRSVRRARSRSSTALAISDYPSGAHEHAAGVLDLAALRPVVVGVDRVASRRPIIGRDLPTPACVASRLVAASTHASPPIPVSSAKRPLPAEVVRRRPLRPRCSSQQCGSRAPGHVVAW